MNPAFSRYWRRSSKRDTRRQTISWLSIRARGKATSTGYSATSLIESAPVAENGLYQGQGGDRCRIGADDTGAERNGVDEILRAQQALLLAGEAALGADQHRHRTGLKALQNSERALRRTGLVAPDKLARPVPAAEQIVERLRLENLRQADQIALLGRLYDIASQAVDVDAFSNGAPGDDRPEPPCPHLCRLLGHVVEPRMFERSEQVIDIGQRRSIAQLAIAAQGKVALACCDNLRQPLAIGTVEQAKRRAPLQAHHMKQIMSLLILQHDGGAGGERCGHIEARRALKTSRLPVHGAKLCRLQAQGNHANNRAHEKPALPRPDRRSARGAALGRQAPAAEAQALCAARQARPAGRLVAAAAPGVVGDCACSSRGGRRHA